MRLRRSLWIVVSIIGIAVAVLCAGTVWRLIEMGPAGIHQKSVKNELAGWEREYGTVRDWHEAWRAADMLEYVRDYYVPGPGYRGSVQSEADLKAQRSRTQAAIVASLHAFTGQDFGTDAARWRKWLTAQGHGEGRNTN